MTSPPARRTGGRFRSTPLGGDLKRARPAAGGELISPSGAGRSGGRLVSRAVSQWTGISCGLGSSLTGMGIWISSTPSVNWAVILLKSASNLSGSRR
jgi:hypothetical protein